MRVVVALGGNALLRRGEPLTAENQRANARVGLQGARARRARARARRSRTATGRRSGCSRCRARPTRRSTPYPLDVLGAQTEGMIGYMIQQELGNELPFEQHLATLLTMIEVDPDDPAFGDPTKPIGPIYDADEAERLAQEKGWAFKPDGDSLRRVVPSPLPKRIFGIEPDRVAARARLRRHLRRRRRDPGHVHGRAGAGGPAARRRRGRDRQGPGERAARRTSSSADALAIVTDVDAVYADWGTPEQRAIRRATPEALAEHRVRGGLDGPEGARRLLVRRGDGRPRGDRLDRATRAALLRGEAGTHRHAATHDGLEARRDERDCDGRDSDGSRPGVAHASTAEEACRRSASTRGPA